ncbi:MAG: hypothetical protein ACRD1Q_13805, partial [Vicinamibacterales bacterium]
HLHLLLNHVPTVGSVVALGLLLLAFVRRDEPLKHAGLEVLFVIAVVTLPVYMSGVAAHLELRDRSELSDNAMRVHQDAALAGFVVTEFAGFVAWIALWQSRRRGRAARGLVPAVTLLSIVALALMARAATLGGEIRHPEILTDLSAGAAAPALSTVEGSPEDPERFLATRISTYMVYSTWAWPAAETVHFLGLSLSFGVLLTVNLRILGVMRQVAFSDVHRWLPWGMLGFGVNLITGMLFFIGQPRQYIESSPFYWKVAFLMIAGANFLYLTVFKKAWTADGDDRLDSSLADKAMAVSSIVAWLAVLYAGRMLPFIGRSF